RWAQGVRRWSQGGRRWSQASGAGRTAVGARRQALVAGGVRRESTASYPIGRRAVVARGLAPRRLVHADAAHSATNGDCLGLALWPEDGQDVPVGVGEVGAPVGAVDVEGLS